MFSKVPVMAWPLLAFACLMVGAFLGDAQHQIAAREPIFPPFGVAVEFQQVNAEPTTVPTPTVTPAPSNGPPGRD